LVDAQGVEGIFLERDQSRLAVDLAAHAKEGDVFRLGCEVLLGVVGATREGIVGQGECVAAERVSISILSSPGSLSSGDTCALRLVLREGECQSGRKELRKCLHGIAVRFVEVSWRLCHNEQKRGRMCWTQCARKR
jgi:hypothetical protein